MAPKVRDIIKMLEFYGWRRERKTRGGHRQFTHPRKPGTVTVPGHKGKEPSEDTWRSIVRQGGLPKRIIHEYPTWKYWRER